MYNSTTIGLGLGGLPSRLLAWGLGTSLYIEIIIVRPKPEDVGIVWWFIPREIIIRVKFRGKIYEKVFTFLEDTRKVEVKGELIETEVKDSEIFVKVRRR